MEANNMAACREALNNIGNAAAWVAENCNDQQTAKYMNDIIAMVQSALAAPARNCDLARDWLQDLYCKFKPPAIVRREMPPEWVDAVMAFCKWLLAPAAERKGDAE